MKRKTFLFYISGHGLGHASRSSEIIRTYHEKNPGDRIILRTAAPKWFFDFTFSFDYEYHRKTLDVGAIQHDFYTVDIPGTLKEYDRIFQMRDELVKEEADFIRENAVDAVFSDIVPLAFDAAHEAGIPGIAHSNFSWDWIYEPYVLQYPEYRHIVSAICASYKKADILLRLPLNGDLSVFRNIIDIPLVARKSMKDRSKIRTILHLPENKPIIFLTFGGLGIDIDSLNLGDGFSDYIFITTQSLAREGSKIIRVSNEELSAKNLGFEDLLNVSDVVMSKPGYGTIAECIANRTRLIYCDREDFVEKEPIIEGICTYLNGVEIPRQDLFSGNWKPYLDTAMSVELPVTGIRTDGADRAAEILQSYISGRAH